MALNRTGDGSGTIPQRERRVIQCPKGHYYDAVRYAKCPHCLQGEAQDSQREKDEVLTQKMGKSGTGQASHKQGGGTSFDETKTIPLYSPQRGNDFLTGWLVCVEGPEKGRDYRIYHGVNWIGRGEKNDIRIQEDRMLSRECQCSLVYEDRKNVFYAVPQSGGLAYLNGKLLEAPELLHTGDKLTIGSSQFQFIAFCEGDRKW